MAAAEASASSKAASLQETPTWAIAAILFLFILVSILFERSIHLLGNWLRRHGKNSLNGAVEKLKEELMLLGFLSLLLAVAQKPIANICVPVKAANTMLPCRLSATSLSGRNTIGFGGFGRKLFSFSSQLGEDNIWALRRVLSGGSDTAASDYCASRGMVSLVSEGGIHQLHLFIFVLAVVHVISAVLTMALGRAKMRSWKAWEEETQTTEYQVANDPRRFRLTRETSFARRHLNFGTKTPVHNCIISFFRQFFSSVTKVDYLTLRHGFISAHFSKFRLFNFHKYIERSLDDDFKTVLRISPAMWFLVAIFMLIDIRGWYSYFWLSFLPLIVVLTVGAKLHLIVMRMADQLDEQSKIITGAPIVQPNNDLFWFGRPILVLFIIHVTIFQNACELAFFIWTWVEFGLNSCYHENFETTIARVLVPLLVQFLCSYITLPLYALVTQMGSDFKRSIIEEKTAKVVRQWHEDVRRKRRQKHILQDSSHSTSITGAANT